MSAIAVMIKVILIPLVVVGFLAAIVWSGLRYGFLLWNWVADQLDETA